jgi:UDP-GlcNAc:undecaprenyl-phosphate GlcNAc-1-phosphate transferase
VLLYSIFDPNLPQDDVLSLAFWQEVGGNLRPAAEPLLLGLAGSLILTPLAILAARRLKIISFPDRARDIHARPTPLLGGLAIYLAFAVGVAAALPRYGQLAGLLVLAGAAALFFLVDDVRPLPAWLKLAVQVLTAAAAIWILDLRISFLTLPGNGIVQLGALAVPLSLAWILGMQNTVNLLDGVDGLAAGVVAIVALTLVIAAASRGQPEIVIAAAALAAACLGFLVFNFHPARIFMGDSGSQFLGLTLALLSIAGVAKVAVAFALVVPALALAVPIADTAWAIIRRRRRGLSIAHADSEHIHHQLLDFGLSQRETCLLFYSATGILGAFGLMLFGHRKILAVTIILLVLGLSTLLGERLKTARWSLPAPALRALLRAE